MQDDGLSALVEAVLTASRVLVGVAAESLSALDEDVTLVQYRALVVCVSRGPLTLAALADALQVNPSTASRLCDRFVERGLLERRPDDADRRQIRLTATARCRELVEAVSAHRRVVLARILGRVPPGQRAHLIDALQAFNDAAGEAPAQAWAQASIL
ncbi:MAG: hypothetical protein V7605_1344 [Acidimicrobiaceae bacterium]